MTSHHDPWRPLETLAAAATGAALAVCAAGWAGLQIAGRLFGSGPPPIGVTDMPGFLRRLPNHLSDPRHAADGPGQAAALPGAAGMYVSLILTLSVAGLAVAGAVRVTRARPADRGARLARPRDLAGLTTRRPVPGRLTLGRAGRRLVTTEARHSVLVVGPPQTGKTTALAIPAILEWPGPVVATSSKTDVLEATRAARERRGEVMVYDPTGNTTASVGWTPLAGVRDWLAAQNAARGLLAAAGPTDGVTDASFWRSSAEMMLAPLLLAGAHDGGMHAVVRWLDAGPDADEPVTQVLADTGDDLAASAWQAITTMDPRTRASVTATARTILAAWWDPGVLGLARPDLTPDRLLTGAGSLFLVSPAHDQDRLQSVFAGIVDQITRAVYTHRARTGRRLDPGLLVVLDEAAHIAPVRNLPELAATGPEPGIQLVTVFHDAAQITAAYGRRAPTVTANHRARLYLPGIGDTDTLTHLSRSLGDTHTPRRTTTTGPAGTSTTTAHHHQPLIPPHELRQMPTGHALLVYGTRPPARIRLRPWYRDRRLRDLAAGGPR